MLCCAMLSRSVMFASVRPHGLQPARLLCLWGFSRQEYWSRLPCPPPGDLPNPGTESRSPALQVDSLPDEPQGSPRLLEWIAYPFSRGICRPKNWNGVSYVAGGFFTSWATRDIFLTRTRWAMAVAREICPKMCSQFRDTQHKHVLPWFCFQI